MRLPFREGQQAARLPRRAQLAALVLFCLLGGGFSKHLLLASIEGETSFPRPGSLARRPRAGKGRQAAGDAREYFFPWECPDNSQPIKK
ncbi:hypothetical protein [Pontibacter liquoris]|uniref:hypothetical protein n=1 Tax=Pontibacter liquoris TaxID=2905677 RepID=UPI001FA80786|nr:hypothetical protein [Pontibacter liquoris]